MSKKHYVQIAIVLKDAYHKAKNTDLEWAIRRLSDELAAVLKKDNARFSYDKWEDFIFGTN
jgi:hypothetical protein